MTDRNHILRHSLLEESASRPWTSIFSELDTHIRRGRSVICHLKHRGGLLVFGRGDELIPTQLI